MMGLNSCLKLLKKYDLCLKVLKKGLEFAWFLKEEEYESDIYEKIGIIYFLLGDMNKSLFYHSRLKKKMSFSLKFQFLK